MAKLRQAFSILSFLMMNCFFSVAQSSYGLTITCVDKDEKYVREQLKLDTVFTSPNSCRSFLERLPFVLHTRGYVAAAIDSVKLDSLSGYLLLFVGEKYNWVQISTREEDEEILETVGWDKKVFTLQPINFLFLNETQEKIIQYLENNGYPFAKIFLDSICIKNAQVSAALKIDKGPLYKIDSIRVFGKTSISNNFLQHYLDIKNKSLFSKEKLAQISKKILALPFLQEVQPFDINLLGSGAILNLYLQTKKSSQLNALIGFSPNQQKNSKAAMWVTGDAQFHLRNVWGRGESLGLQWQQLQQKSPRLHIFFQQPFFLNTETGVDFAFDMLRKDSSFLNMNIKVGALSKNIKIFLQQAQSIINEGGINSNQVINTKKLPDIMDVAAISFGVELEKDKTNYRLNPREGYEYQVLFSAGTKNSKKNNQIVSLKDPWNPLFDFSTLYDSVKLKSFQLKSTFRVSYFFRLAKQGTIKTMLQGGLLMSDKIFRNELFQIGGYKLLRGFNEESEWASQYLISTAEYRYLIGQNSFFYGFTDFALTNNVRGFSNSKQYYLGVGLGLAFETKTGIINLAWAVGKKEKEVIDFKQSKLHFGFVNYF